MRNIKEGNVYNVEDEISGNPDASTTGLAKWQIEIRKMLIAQLRRQNIPNPEKVIAQTFGSTLD